MSSEEGQATPWHYRPPWDPDEWRKAQRARWKTELKRRMKQFGAAVCLSLFIYVVLEWIIMAVMTAEVAENLILNQDYLFVVTPAIVPILTLSGGSLVAFYIFLAVAITVSLAYMLTMSAAPLSREIAEGRPGRHSTMLTTGGLLLAVLSTTLIYYLILEAGGTSPNVPGFEEHSLWALIYTFAKAAVWEEIVARMLLIGVPLLWIDVLLRRGQLLPASRYFLGGKIRPGHIECGLVLFSAMMFGLGHAQNWDLWKVPPTVVAGLAFGYLFLRIGLYAAIVFHFSIDFLAVPLYYFDVSATPTVALLGYAILEWIWIIAGVMFAVYYCLILTRFVRTDLLRIGCENRKTDDVS